MSTRPHYGQCFQFVESGSCRFGDACKFKHVSASEATSTAMRRGPTCRATQRASTKTHLNDFFALYPSYGYDSSNPVMQEFDSMCDFFDWKKDDEERDGAHRLLQDAMTLQFNDMYGTEVNNLDAWHGLCRVLRIHPLPGDVDECQRLIKSTHVNLVDLIDRQNKHQTVTKFRSEVALSKYTKDNGKFFPRENAYAGGLLKFLLRQIMNPSEHRIKNSGRRGRGGTGSVGRARMIRVGSRGIRGGSRGTRGRGRGTRRGQRA